MAIRSFVHFPNGLCNKDGPDSLKVSKSNLNWQTSGSEIYREEKFICFDWQTFGIYDLNTLMVAVQ
jgi:hypothetical protein